MNYAQIITESETELKEFEERQKLVQFQNECAFFSCSKAVGQQHKKRLERGSAGKSDNRKRFGSFTGAGQSMKCCENLSDGISANY